MKKFDINLFNKEYDKFENVSPVQLPEGLSASIQGLVKKKLGFSKIRTFFGITVLHCFSALITLALCPQFEVQIFKNFKGLLDIFMLFGHHVCLFLCGAFFVSVSLIFSHIFIPRIWKAYLYSIKYYYVSYLFIISLLGFSVISSVSIDIFTLLWSLGILSVGFILSNFIKNIPNLFDWA